MNEIEQRVIAAAVRLASATLNVSIAAATRRPLGDAREELAVEAIWHSAAAEVHAATLALVEAVDAMREGAL